VIPQHKDSGLTLEEFPDDIRTKIPQLGNLAHREVSLLKARL
jgi:hypothetical protein